MAMPEAVSKLMMQSTIRYDTISEASIAMLQYIKYVHENNPNKVLAGSEGILKRTAAEGIEIHYGRGVASSLAPMTDLKMNALLMLMASIGDSGFPMSNWMIAEIAFDSQLKFSKPYMAIKLEDGIMKAVEMHNKGESIGEDPIPAKLSRFSCRMPGGKIYNQQTTEDGRVSKSLQYDVQIAGQILKTKQ